jgi:hypothetical protein
MPNCAACLKRCFCQFCVTFSYAKDVGRNWFGD